MSFRDQLLHTIDRWNKQPIEDEWLFENFRDKFVSQLSASEAFEAIAQTVSILLEQSDESTAIEVLQTVLALARRSDTTELPSMLLENKQSIASKFAGFGEYANSKLEELLRYYRI